MGNASTRKSPARPLALAIAAMTLAAAPAPHANALPGTFTPSLSVEQWYDSNILDAPKGSEEGDFILRLRPAVSFAFPAVDTAVKLDAMAETDTYYRNSGLDEYPATWQVAVSPVRPIAFSPSFTVTPRGYYLDTYDSTRRSQLVFSPEAPAIPIEIVTFPRTHTRDYGGSVGMGWQAAPRFQTSLTAAYNAHEYVQSTPGLTDYYTLRADLALLYQPGPRSTAGVYGAADITSYSNDLVSNTYTVGLQGGYTVTEFFRVDGRVGYSFLNQDPGGGLPETRNQSPSGSFSLTYRNRDFFTSLWGSFGYSAGSSFGETTLQGNAGLSLGDQFAQGWWWNLSGSYQANRNIDNPSSRDLVSGNANAEIRYVPLDWMTVRLSGGYFREWDKSVTGQDRNDATALLGVTFSKTYPMFK